MFSKAFSKLIFIYIECLERGCFPRNWKIGRVVPILKPGKEDSLDPSKYRIISLLNIGGKLLEKLLINLNYAPHIQN
jgi:hypothetical protein